MSFRLLPRLAPWRCVGGSRRWGRVLKFRGIGQSTSEEDVESGKADRRLAWRCAYLQLHQDCIGRYQLLILSHCPLSQAFRHEEGVMSAA